MQAQAVKVKSAVCKVAFVLSRKTSHLEMHTLPKSRWNFWSPACSCEPHFLVSSFLSEFCVFADDRGYKLNCETELMY